MTLDPDDFLLLKALFSSRNNSDLKGQIKEGKLHKMFSVFSISGCGDPQPSPKPNREGWLHLSVNSPDGLIYILHPTFALLMSVYLYT